MISITISWLFIIAILGIYLFLKILQRYFKTITGVYEHLWSKGD